MRLTALLVTLALPSAMAAQASDSLSLRNRSMLVGGLGLTGTREASVSQGQTKARATGQVGSLSFLHFVKPHLGFEIAAAVLDADATAAYANNKAAAVTALLFGLNYSPASLALTKSMRPYFSAAIGPYLHHVSETSAGPTYAEARTQSQVGARFGAGINFFLARHFALQLEGDYHLVKAFEAINGVAKDPSGLGLSFGLAFVWGGK